MPDRKPRTRANREGRPYQRKSDGKWCAPVYLPGGKRKIVYGGTRKEVLERQKATAREIADGLPVTAGRADTLERYLEGWLTVTLRQRVAAGRMRERTLDSYRYLVEMHIIPHLGGVRLVDLGTAHIRAWLLELADKPSRRPGRKPREGEVAPPPARLSAQTVAHAHATLRRALNDAVDDEIVRRNVCLLVDPPSPGKAKVRELTKDEVRRLLAAAAGHRLWAYWVVLLGLGLRRGEGLGLRWEDVDLDAGTVRLREAVQRLRGEVDPETGRRKGRLVRTELKTEESRATLKLPAFVAAALREHRAAQEAERKRAGVWVGEGMVFASTIGTPLEPRNINRLWGRICERAGVERCRVHDLRHACGTLLFGEGVSLKVIQGVLRHTRLSTTAEVYVHLLEEVRDAAAETMDGVLVDLAAERGKRSAS